MLLYNLHCVHSTNRKMNIPTFTVCAICSLNTFTLADSCNLSNIQWIRCCHCFHFVTAVRCSFLNQLEDLRMGYHSEFVRLMDFHTQLSPCMLFHSRTNKKQIHDKWKMWFSYFYQCAYHNIL